VAAFPLRKCLYFNFGLVRVAIVLANNSTTRPELEKRFQHSIVSSFNAILSAIVIVAMTHAICHHVYLGLGTLIKGF